MKKILFSFFLLINQLNGSIFSIEDLTLEEKVGQLLIVHFQGVSVNEEAITLVQNAFVGGMVYYEWANELSSPQQIQNLSNGLQLLTEKNRYPIGLFISIDQEGGLVTRLKSGFTVFPGNWALGVTQDHLLSECCAYAMGKEMRAVGINLNFAPVVDINCNPHNPVIGIRAFSDSQKSVIEHAKSALLGYAHAHIISTLKHFPGHGDVTIDSHENLPVVHKSKEQLKQVELFPYQELLKSADMIMTAHLSVPALDPEHCATLSRPILVELLRKEMGYQGIVISDSLIMRGLLDQCSSIEEAALLAFNAGCDSLLLGGRTLIGKDENHELKAKDVLKVHRFLVDAVKDGRISHQRLDESVKRILDLKKRYGLIEASLHSREEIDQYVHTVENQLLAEAIAQRSVKMEKNALPESFHWKEKKIAVLASSIVGELVQNSSQQIGKETQFLQFSSQFPTKQEQTEALHLVQRSEAVIICSYNAWKFPEQRAFIQSVIEESRLSVVIALRDPFDATLFPKAHAVITTCSPTAVSLDAALRRVIN